jgi:nitrite reductase/ring-hydroxylating ferredoxin subunit
VLSDGTPLRELIDLDRREVSLRVVADPEVFELELSRLFTRAWTIIGHESEVPRPGDYVTRTIGCDPVVIVRQPDGEIGVFLNVCTHRGMQVCRAEVGNATKFRCAYHGWVFGPDGKFQAAPFEKEMYGDILDKSSLGLQRARAEQYAGIIFATWDPHAEPLSQFLGDYTWYLDAVFRRTRDGLEVAGAPHRFVIRSNWKAAAEQFGGADGYHGLTLHRSMYELQAGVQRDLTTLASRVGVDISTPQGHGLRCLPNPLLAGRDLTGLSTEQLREAAVPQPILGGPPWPTELVSELSTHLSDSQLRMLASCPPNVGGLFPNGAFLGSVVHAFVPLTPTTFELTNWVLVEKGASEDYKEQIRRSEARWWWHVRTGRQRGLARDPGQLARLHGPPPYDEVPDLPRDQPSRRLGR